MVKFKIQEQEVGGSYLSSTKFSSIRHIIPIVLVNTHKVMTLPDTIGILLTGTLNYLAAKSLKPVK